MIFDFLLWWNSWQKNKDQLRAKKLNLLQVLEKKVSCWAIIGWETFLFNISFETISVSKRYFFWNIISFEKNSFLARYFFRKEKLQDLLSNYQKSNFENIRDLLSNYQKSKFKKLQDLLSNCQKSNFEKLQDLQPNF